ncbi:hypothetical protein HGM15179_018897 [Zosterops borbonicus]|uniref:Uncharacterized protein n=1 Tax=Zosterops borbonicus TaxID=364589 RepID=A0A8K1D9Q1_9PASS|nr:hypothetical protein HGM15179_018897 [Zosterops borbonicus]
MLLLLPPPPPPPPPHLRPQHRKHTHTQSPLSERLGGARAERVKLFLIHIQLCHDYTKDKAYYCMNNFGVDYLLQLM